MEPRSFLNDRVVLHHGDCLVVLDEMAENSVDSVVCDPPYHLQSIVKRFAKTGRTDKTRTSSGPHQRTVNGFMNRTWDGGDIAFRSETWAKVLRVLKPGGYILAFSSSRTFGRMSVAIEDAGFITHPLIGWLFAQGFPKAHRVHAPGWEGWRYGGQALKPALEPIYMGQKPFSEKTGTANVERWGCGAINIGGCRVGPPTDTRRPKGNGSGAFPHSDDAWVPHLEVGGQCDAGRWPANLMHDGSPEVIAAFPDSDGQQGDVRGDEPSNFTNAVYGQFAGRPATTARADSGSAARFFWSSKAGADDRLGSKHPTVKPLDLLQELCRLVTPPGGIVLDCFAGTGTTGEAAYREGFRAILIEREAEYVADIERRMALVLAGPDERARESVKARNLPIDAGPLFGKELA